MGIMSLRLCHLSLPLRSCSPSHGSACRPARTLALAIRSNTERHGHSLMFDPLPPALIPLAVVSPKRGGGGCGHSRPHGPSPPASSPCSPSLLHPKHPVLASPPGPLPLSPPLFFLFYRTSQPTRFHFLRPLRLFTSVCPGGRPPFFLSLQPLGPRGSTRLPVVHTHACLHSSPVFLAVVVLLERPSGGVGGGGRLREV